MDALHRLVRERSPAAARRTHSGRLLARGTPKVVQKLGEEVFETLIEAISGDRARLVGESADVLYHLVVLWVDAGVRPEQVWHELERREGIGGLVEKRARAAAPAADGEGSSER